MAVQSGEVNADQLDYTNKFNTPLTPEEQTEYDKRFKPSDSYDYDMQGWFKANRGEKHEGGEHYPDMWKKPNHPTFSDESMYHGDQYKGGHWNDDNTFTPGITNLQLHGQDRLEEYFNKNEPDYKLKIDRDTPPPGSSESFNQFKDRILSAMTGYAQNNDGQNTAIVTHSKPIGVYNGWEHAGYPDNGDIHMPTYEEVKDKKPGNHQEISLPDYIIAQQAREAAAYRTQQSVQPEEGRQEGPITEWMVDTPHRMGNQLYEQGKQFFTDPESAAAGLANPSHLDIPMIGITKGGVSPFKFMPWFEKGYKPYSPRKLSDIEQMHVDSFKSNDPQTVKGIVDYFRQEYAGKGMSMNDIARAEKVPEDVLQHFVNNNHAELNKGRIDYAKPDDPGIVGSKTVPAKGKAGDKITQEVGQDFWDKENEGLLRQRLSEGVDKASIADELGISAEAMNDKLSSIAKEELGVNLGVSKTRIKTINRKANEEGGQTELDNIKVSKPVDRSKERAYELRKSGMTVNQVHKQMQSEGSNIARSTVVEVSKGLPAGNFTQKQRPEYYANRQTVTENLDKIKDLLNQNKTLDQIGKEVGVDKTALGKHLDVLGVDRPKRGPKKPEGTSQEQALRALMERKK